MKSYNFFSENYFFKNYQMNRLMCIELNSLSNSIIVLGIVSGVVPRIVVKIVVF